MGAYMPPHGRAVWDGTASLPQLGDQRSVLTGDRLRTSVALGDIVWTKADDGARGGMVIDIEVGDDGERSLLILSHNQNRERPQAWMLRLAESDIDPAKTLPGSTNSRHAYAKACYLAAGQGRYVTDKDLRLVDVAATVIAGCVRG